MEMVIRFPGGARVDAHAGDLVIRTDQPAAAGGEGSAPSPFMLFLASLGTCSGIYVLSFLEQRGLPTEDVQIREEIVRDPATHMVSSVTLHIDLPAGFPKKYERALIRAAELCAVKKHLETPPAMAVEAHIG